MSIHSQLKVIKPGLFLLCTTPFVVYVYLFFDGKLGANPIEAVTRSMGDWSLRFLLVTLAFSPIVRLTGWNNLVRYRRMLGLFTFFYVCVHISLYISLDKYFDIVEIYDDVIKRPFITAGFTAFILLIPLAVTSSDKMIELLKFRWILLHRLIYIIAILAVLHFWWMVKIDTREPALYAVVLTVLLVIRLFYYAKRKI